MKTFIIFILLLLPVLTQGQVTVQGKGVGNTYSVTNDIGTIQSTAGDVVNDSLAAEIGRLGFSSKAVHLRTHVENNNIVNVLDYGAIPNDEIEDTDAIQTAIDTKYHVYIPAGIYLVDSLVMAQRGQIISGQGSERTSSTGTMLKPASNKCTLLILGAALQMEVREISFYGYVGSDTAKYGIRMTDGGSGHSIVQCEFEQFSFGTSSTQWNSIPYPDTSYAIYDYSTFDVHVQFCRFFRNDVHFRGVGGTQVTQFYGCELFQSHINDIWLTGGSTFAFYGGNLEMSSVYSGYDALVRLENVYNFSFYDWSSETGNAYNAWNTQPGTPGANDSLNIGWIKIAHPGDWYTITAENGGVITLDQSLDATAGNDTLYLSDWAETADMIVGEGDTLRIGSEKMILFRYPAAGNTEWYVRRLGTPATHSAGDTVYVYEWSSTTSTNVVFRGGGFSGGSYHSLMRAHLPVVVDCRQAKRPVNITMENVWINEFLEDIVRRPSDPYLAKDININVKNSYVNDAQGNFSYIEHLSNIDTRDIPDTTSWLQGYGGGHTSNVTKFGRPVVLERQDAYNHTPQALLTFYQDNDNGYFDPYNNKWSLKVSNPHPYTGSATDMDYAVVYNNATTQADFNWAADSSRTIMVWFKPQKFTGGGGGSGVLYVQPTGGSLLYTSQFKPFQLYTTSTYLNTSIYDEFDNGVTEVIHYYGGTISYVERGKYPKDNMWSMMAWVRDATTDNSPNGRVIAYIDGSFHYETFLPTDETYGVVPQILRYMNGQVDDLAVYRGVLTASQIDSIYNRGKCPDLQTYPSSAVDSLLCWFDMEYSNYGAGAGVTKDTIYSVTDPTNEYILLGNGTDAETKPMLVKDSPTYSSMIQGYSETDNYREGDDVFLK